MNVGIVVYSHTGNTLSVAEKLAQGIRASGHAVQIVRIEPVDSNLQAKPPVKLQSVPDISTFDVVVFASPIHGFTLAQAMKAYLEQLPDLEGKFIYSYVTQHLKWAWMGGKRVADHRNIVQGQRRIGSRLCCDPLVFTPTR